MVTNAIANAGLRVRWNIWNLYIHLCWLTVEQQFNPALAIASAVTIKFKKSRQTTDKQNITTFLVHWKLFLRETRVRQSRILSTTVLTLRLDWLGEFPARKTRLDNLARQTRLDLSVWQFYPTILRIFREICEKTFNELDLTNRNWE